MLDLIIIGESFSVNSHAFGQILVEEVFHQHFDDLASPHYVLRLAYFRQLRHIAHHLVQLLDHAHMSFTCLFLEFLF